MFNRPSVLNGAATKAKSRVSSPKPRGAAKNARENPVPPYQHGKGSGKHGRRHARQNGLRIAAARIAATVNGGVTGAQIGAMLGFVARGEKAA